MSRIDLNVALIAPESEILVKYCTKTDCQECLCRYQCDMVSTYGKTLNTMFSKKLDFIPCNNLPVLDFNGIGYIVDKADWSLIPVCEENNSCDDCPVKGYCSGINNTTLGIKFTLDLIIDKIKKEATASTL